MTDAPSSTWRITFDDRSGIPLVVDCFEEERTKAVQEGIAKYRQWRPEHPNWAEDFWVTHVRELVRAAA